MVVVTTFYNLLTWSRDDSEFRGSLEIRTEGCALLLDASYNVPNLMTEERARNFEFAQPQLEEVLQLLQYDC